MEELKARSADPDFPGVLFVYPGTAEQGAPFFQRSWPEARAVSDPDGRFYQGFGLGRGGFRQLFGLRVWMRAAGAFVRGHRIGKPTGDPLLMPGAFLWHNDHLVWEFRPGNAAEPPPYDQIPRRSALEN